MVDPQIPKCPQCGAPLPRVGGGWATRCGFCNVDVTLGMPAARQPRAFAEPPAPKSTRYLVLGVVGGTLLLAVVIGLVGTRSRRPTVDPNSAFAGTDPFQWNPHSRVVVVSLPGQRREAFLGSVHPIVESDRSRPMVVHVALFSGDSFAEVWRSPSLGRFNEDNASEAVHFAAAGARVVYTDVRNVAQVVELTTGRATASVQLTDRALSVCASATGAVWVEVADQQHVLIDPTTGRGAPGARPADCVPTRGSGAASCGNGRARSSAPCVDVSSDTVPGMSTRTMLTGPNGTSVAFGVRSPGTQVPMVAAKNAGGVLWQRPLPGDSVGLAAETGADAFDVVGDSVFAVFHQRDYRIRVIGIDVATGQTLWESSTPRSQSIFPSVITVGRDRVYVPHFTWLDVFDRATGAHVRTMGRW